MRRSEILGLARNDTYYDLDLENATFEVNKSRHYLAGKGKFTKYPYQSEKNLFQNQF